MANHPVLIEDALDSDDNVTVQVVKSAIHYLPLVINGGSDYFFSVKTASDIYKSMEQIQEYPHIDIGVIGIRYMNANPGENALSVLIKEVDLRLNCFLFLEGNIALGQLRMLRDLEKFFMSREYRRFPDVTDFSKHWARACMFKAAKMFGMTSTTPNCGIELDITVYTGQDILTPSQRA